MIQAVYSLGKLAAVAHADDYPVVGKHVRMHACRIYTAAVVGVMVAAAAMAPGHASAQSTVRTSSSAVASGDGVVTSSTSASAGTSVTSDSSRVKGNTNTGGIGGIFGGVLPRRRGGLGDTTSSVVCTSSASSAAFADMSDAHVSAITQVFAEFCRPDFDGRIVFAAQTLADSGFAIAEAIAKAQTSCVSQGNAVGCASASASAQAWAEATAEAHAMAVVTSAERCDCLAGAAALSVSSVSTFIELVVEAFAVAEANACVQGDDSASASAYANCSAASYAAVFATVRPPYGPLPDPHASACHVDLTTSVGSAGPT